MKQPLNFKKYSYASVDLDVIHNDFHLIFLLTDGLKPPIILLIANFFGSVISNDISILL